MRAINSASLVTFTKFARSASIVARGVAAGANMPIRLSLSN